MARRIPREHLAELGQSDRAKDKVLLSIAETVDSLSESFDRLDLAIRGDETLGHTGIIHKQKDVSKRLKRLETLVTWGSGACVAIGLIYQALKHRMGLE